MKTTMEIPTGLLREVKAKAALRGLSMKDFVVEALKEKLAAESRQAQPQPGWRGVYGKATKKSVQQVREVVDSEFSRVDEADWK